MMNATNKPRKTWTNKQRTFHKELAEMIESNCFWITS
jgi:hypothetical protein